MATYRLTAKRDIGNVVKKGTTVVIVTTGNTPPQWHHVKKELNLTTSLSPAMNESTWIIEKID
ncbi:MAG: hypothetical protein FJZ66_07650 [Bacteroidetes bacterium]|nr:hypothetical protein [Bacteroidota bacterium]